MTRITSSRHTSLVLNGQNDKAKEKGLSPEQARLKDWLDQLDRLNLKDVAAARTLVTHVASHQAFAAFDLHRGATATDFANDVFNDLIEHEAYDLFVDVFNQHNDTLRAHAEADGMAFKATLVLRLPRDWCPCKLTERDAAFQRLEIERLHVVGTWREQDELLEISAAACQCLASLLSCPRLKGVAIDGLLQDVEVVRKALKYSKVNALDFPYSAHKAREATDAECFVSLLTDEAMRDRWVALNLEHHYVLTLLAQKMTPEVEWPELRALSAPLLGGPSCLPAFLKIVTCSPRLTSVALLKCADLGVQKLDRIFLGQDRLTGLADLPSLTRLDIQCVNGNAWLRVVCAAAIFRHLTACVSLTHLSWEFAHESFASDFENLSVELLCRRWGDMEEALKKPDLPLKSITIKRAYLTEGILLSLFDALAHNTSVEELDLSGCWLDIGATRRLIEILKINKTLKKVLLPTDPDGYYLTSTANGQAVRRFLSASELSSMGAPWGFQLEDSGVPGSDVSDFDADLKTHAETLLWQVEQALRGNAMPELVSDLARFMAIAARDKLAANLDVAGVVARELEAQGALRSLVHLSQVATQVSGDRLKRHGDVRPYVMAHNKMSSAKDLPDAPLVINTVAENGENVALNVALKSNKPLRVQRLLDKGAIDFGGKVQRKALPGQMLDAFIAAEKVRGNAGQRRARLPVNRVNAAGENLMLLAAVRSKDPKQVLHARALGAVDNGNRVFKQIPKIDKAMRAAFKKVAVLPTTTTTTTAATATTTTTTTTTTTSATATTATTSTKTDSPVTAATTAATQPRPLVTRRARDADKDKNA